MRKIVVDSSIIVKWVSKDNEQRTEQSDRLLRDVEEGKVVLMAPELARYELGNALVKKQVVPSQAFQSLSTVYSLPVQFVSETEELAIQTFEMAHEARVKRARNTTYYDAAFTALAKREGAVLVTDNPKHQSKTRGVKVVSLKEYK